MDDKLITPYNNYVMYSKIKLLPHEMNNDLHLNLKIRLKKKLERKCNKYGYVDKIFRILDYESGIIVPESLDSSATFNIKFSCRICKPFENKEIIGKIELINKVLVKASIGPIIIIIKSNDINKSKFSLNNNNEIIYNKNNIKLNAGIHARINVLKYNFHPNDNRIIVLGELIDLANKKEIKKYYTENNTFQDNNLSESIVSINENDSNVESEPNDEILVKNENYIDL